MGRDEARFDEEFKRRIVLGDGASVCRR